MLSRIATSLLVVTGIGFLAGCRTVTSAPQPLPGDEIIVAGERFHTGTRVVSWLEAKGYNGYAGLPPLRLRQVPLPPADRAAVEQHGWTLPTLQRVVDQFVLHYDTCGTSKRCFEVLHARQLSVHFLLDVDGTIYQTLDLQERALHATTSNDRSLGVELANIGAYPPNAAEPLKDWYGRDPDGGTEITVPKRIQNSGIATPGFLGRPARADPVAGSIQGQSLIQYDFTPEQYAALAKLTAALGRVFPRLRCDYPHRFFDDEPRATKLSDRQLARYRGLLGHYHLQENKIDPGPAFDWRRFRAEVRQAMR